ncbi:hypothetical protein HJFPF1_05538 [Paramyrothecium foliicola]|nr:hypothetical protein HJFPF1_05538 [Paramyrothecium foliicola]
MATAVKSKAPEGLIAPLVNKNLALFKTLIMSLENDASRLSSATSLSERFKLWAASLGAHRSSGNRSLEYRLRDASFIRIHILSLLRDLHASINEAISMVSRENSQALLEEASDSSFDELDDYFEVDEMDEKDPLGEAIETTRHVIECLLRLSVMIRSPAPHDQFKSRVNIAHYEEYDISHIRSKFPDLSDDILKRVATATARRRQYFKYREEHTIRLAEGIDDENALHEHATTVASSLPDHLKHSATFMDDNYSDISGTSFASSANATTELRVPPMPKGAEEGPFKCPFCHMIVLINNRNEWKRHVFRDLQPYTCLVNNCPVPDQLYARRSHWIRHMKSDHWRIWRCAFGCSGAFYSRKEFSAHSQSAHEQQVDVATLAGLEGLSSEPDSAMCRGNCPLCTTFQYTSIHQYKRHVGRHLEDLALWTLPSIGNDEEDAAGDKSNADEMNHDTDSTQSHLETTDQFEGFASELQSQSNEPTARLEKEDEAAYGQREAGDGFVPQGLEKLRLEPELAAFEAKQGEAKLAAMQAEWEVKDRKDAEEAFQRRMEELRQAQKEAAIEIEKAKAEVERAAQKRIETERKAGQGRAEQYDDVMHPAKEEISQELEAELKGGDVRGQGEEDDRPRAEQTYGKGCPVRAEHVRAGGRAVVINMFYCCLCGHGPWRLDIHGGCSACGHNRC